MKRPACGLVDNAPPLYGIVERFFRSLKEECVWQHNFSDFAEARAAITQ